jgi:hypothetical protein
VDLDVAESRTLAIGHLDKRTALEVIAEARALRADLARHEDREARALTPPRQGRCLDCGSDLHDAHEAGPEDDEPTPANPTPAAPISDFIRELHSHARRAEAADRRVQAAFPVISPAVPLGADSVETGEVTR